jgi:hypothetical protein
MDLSESNICGFRSTSHPVTDLSSKNWTDSAVNCHLPLDADVGSYYDNSTRAWVKSADHTNLFYCGLQADGAQHLPTQTQSWVDHYGNGLYFTSQSAAPSCVDGADSTKCHYGAGETIDTTRDYDVRVTFDWNPKGYLNGFTTTLSQGSNSLTISRQTSPNAANVPSAGGFPLDGRVALLVQVSKSQLFVRDGSFLIVFFAALDIIAYELACRSPPHSTETPTHNSLAKPIMTTAQVRPANTSTENRDFHLWMMPRSR